MIITIILISETLNAWFWYKLIVGKWAHLNAQKPRFKWGMYFLE